MAASRFKLFYSPIATVVSDDSLRSVPGEKKGYFVSQREQAWIESREDRGNAGRYRWTGLSSLLHSLTPRGDSRYTKMPHTYFLAAGGVKLRKKGQTTTTRALKPPQQKTVLMSSQPPPPAFYLSIGERKKEGKKEGKRNFLHNPRFSCVKDLSRFYQQEQHHEKEERDR